MTYVLGMAVADLPVADRAEEPAAASTRDLVLAKYDAHQCELFGVTLRGCRDRETAEDIVQEAFLRLIVEVEAGRVPDNVRAWLHRVTANLVVTRSRRTTVARKWSRHFAVDAAAVDPAPRLLEGERRSELESALAELSSEARTALLLAARGFSGLEIAETIGQTTYLTTYAPVRCHPEASGGVRSTNGRTRADPSLEPPSSRPFSVSAGPPGGCADVTPLTLLPAAPASRR